MKDEGREGFVFIEYVLIFVKEWYSKNSIIVII